MFTFDCMTNNQQKNKTLQIQIRYPLLVMTIIDFMLIFFILLNSKVQILLVQVKLLWVAFDREQHFQARRFIMYSQSYFDLCVN